MSIKHKGTTVDISSYVSISQPIHPDLLTMPATITLHWHKRSAYLPSHQWNQFTTTQSIPILLLLSVWIPYTPVMTHYQTVYNTMPALCLSRRCNQWLTCHIWKCMSIFRHFNSSSAGAHSSLSTALLWYWASRLLFPCRRSFDYAILRSSKTQCQREPTARSDTLDR